MTRDQSAFQRRDILVLLMLGVLLLAACAARLLVGNPIPRLDTGTIDWETFRDVLAIRSDRLVIGLAVGAALAVSGVLLQALLRNPLASPYILGISSGSALGVMIFLYFVWLSPQLAFAGGQHGAAAIGAGVTMLVVYLFAQRRGWIDPIGLLLVGVIVNAINGAAIMFVQSLAPKGLRGDLMTWMMGYFNDSLVWEPTKLFMEGRADPITLVVLITIVGFLISVWMGRAMDVATFSDAEAHSLGVNLAVLRLVMFLVAGVMTAGSVVLAGPIGFVGLICPHWMRLLTGPRHRPLVIGSAMLGAGLVVAADVAIKALDVYWLESGLMPIGVLTALIGGPAFLIMLRPQLGRGGGT